jgi:hypothetical protein
MPKEHRVQSYFVVTRNVMGNRKKQGLKIRWTSAKMALQCLDGGDGVGFELYGVTGKEKVHILNSLLRIERSISHFYPPNPAILRIV